MCTVALLTALPARAEEPAAVEFRDGRWQPVVSPIAEPTHDATLDRVENLLEQRQANAARKLATQWLKTHQRGPLFDRALFLMAEALYQEGDRVEAFYYLDELLDEFPESKLFYPALGKQYQIADDFLSGAKRRVLGIFYIGAQDEAVEMLYRIQQRSPGSPLAEKALLRTADYYYTTSDFDLASDAYSVYAKTYPRSKMVPRVKLREAYSSLAQFRGLKFDASKMLDARTQLEDIRTAYPELADEENIDSLLESIDIAFARKLWVTADFYRRTHEPEAAAYVFKQLVDKYPNTEEATSARKYLMTVKLSGDPNTAPAVSQPVEAK